MSTTEHSRSRQPEGEYGGSQHSAGNRKKGRKKKRNPVLRALGAIGKLLGTLLLIMLVTGCFVACYGVVYIQTVIIPNAAPNLDMTLNESSTIYYVDKNSGETVELATCYGTENREILEYHEIPQVFVEAAVSIEDHRFYEHKGVDWWRTAGAIYYMFTGQDIQGGSTITQQVIKNYTGKNEVTVKRKITEIFKALELEKEYSKDDIMAMYLNYIFLGSNQYGIATASEFYFGKDVSEITLAEAASIIAITNNPALYGPNSPTVITNPETGVTKTAMQMNKDRQELILYRMKELEKISQEEYEEAVAQELVFTMNKDEEGEVQSNINSWYVDEVIAETVRFFKEEYDLSSEAANQMVYGGGLKIYTPFDPKVQEAVDNVYTNVDNLPYVSSDGQQMQSGITVMDNETGYIVAMAGAMGEKTGNRMWNNAVDSTRQPGSSIKPLAAYSPAIELGLVTPASVIDDSPYSIENGNPWPRNDNRVYKGLTTVLTGITHSTNTIAVKLVGDYVTPEASYQFLQERYGITTLVKDEEINGKIKTDVDEAPLALGGLTKGLSPYEMTAAYATFPRGGAYTEPTVILRVETKDGELVWDNTPETTYPIKESTAYYMNTLLQSAIKGTGNAARFNGMHLAGKTGTTSDNYDRWFAGYTPYYTAVVWTGYRYNAKMVTDRNPAAALWGKVMSQVHAELPDKDFFTPSTGLVTRSICLDCGELSNETCANDIRGSRTQSFTFVEGTQPTSYCVCHVPITVCTADPYKKGEGDSAEVVANTYHLATDFCPEDTVKEVYVVDYTRGEVCEGVEINDMYYLKSFYDGMAEPYCSFHTSIPMDPTDPEFGDPNLPPDWLFPPHEGEDQPTDDPGVPPYVEPSDTPTQPPVDTPEDTPPEDEYVPAG